MVNKEDVEGFRRGLETAGITVHDIYRIPPELEDVFVQLIAHSERSAGGTPAERAAWSI